MHQDVRENRDWRHWTGRVLPVLAVALLAIGPAHSKDKKKKQKETVQAEQVMGKEAPKPETSASSKPARRISLDKIVEDVRKRHKAQVIKTEQKEKDGRLIYELKLLSDEKGVWTVRVDAETGKEL